MPHRFCEGENCHNCESQAICPSADENTNENKDKRLQRKTREIQNQIGAPKEVAEAFAFAAISQEAEQPRREPSFPANYDSLNHEEKMRFLRRLRAFEEGR